MDKTVATIIAECLKDSHETLEKTMDGVTNEVAHWQPQGKALPISAAYAHVVISEDVLLSSMVKKTPPLLAGEWGKKLGLSLPHPEMDAKWEENFSKWSKEVKMDLPKFQEYAKAVYKESEDFISSLTDTDLTEKKADLSSFQMGEWPLLKFILRLLISHVDSLTGEISAAKGLQGLKGYPF